MILDNTKFALENNQILNDEKVQIKKIEFPIIIKID